MGVSAAVTAVIVVYAMGSLAYVYRYRGATRYLVDEIYCVWRDGEDFVFDETYPHYAENNTDTNRLILLCDVERPLNPLGRVFNSFYRLLARATVVPNTPEDERGLFSAVFATLAPMQERALRLRTQRRWLYNVCKFSLNMTLLAALMLIPAGLLLALEAVLRG